MRVKLYVHKSVGSGKRSWIAIPGLKMEETEVGFDLWFLGKKLQLGTKASPSIPKLPTILESSDVLERLKQTVKDIGHEHITGMFPIPAVRKHFEKKGWAAPTGEDFFQLERTGKIGLHTAHDPNRPDADEAIPTTDRGLVYFVTLRD